MRKRSLSIGLKIGVSAVLLVYCFRRVGWEALWTEIAGAHVGWVLIYVAVSFLATLVSALKWHVLVTARGLSASRSRLAVLYMVGYFFNNILPTSVGGDVVRAYELGKTDDKHAEAMASVFIERFTGLTALILFAIVTLIIEPRFFRDIKLALALGGVCAAYLSMIVLVFQRASLRFLQTRLTFSPVQRILHKMQKLQEAILLYQHERRALWVSMLYSGVFYVITVFIIYIGCLTFGYMPDLGELFLVVPTMHILFMIPISLGGIGLQEWAYTVVLSMLGVPAAVGLSIALLYRIRTIVFGLIGGAVYPLLTSLPRPRSTSVIRTSN